MPHRRRRHGGGRKFDPHARRRATTRAGRRGIEVRDLGSAELRRRKRAATGREDLEVSAVGVLYGRGYIDNQQYTKLAGVTALLQRVSRAMGRGISVNGLWLAIVAAGSRSASYALPLAGDLGARRQLFRICQELDGCKSLVVEFAEERTLPPLVIRAIENRLDPHDLYVLEKLRRGLDGITVRLDGLK